MFQQIHSLNKNSCLPDDSEEDSSDEAPTVELGLEDIADIVQQLAYTCQMNSKRELDHRTFRGAVPHGSKKRLWSLASTGKLSLFQVVGEHVQIFHLSIQEFLAAEHAWKI